MKKYLEATLSRRKFLSRGALLGAGTIVAVTVPSVASATPEVEKPVEKKEEGYRMTQHIADYYATAKL